MRKRIISTGLHCVFILLILFGCAKKATEPKKATPTQPANIAQPLMQKTQQQAFTITVSQGGGFTGRYSGYTISSDGTASHWQKVSAVKKSTLWKISTDSVEVKKLAASLHNLGIFDIEYQETGNLTKSIFYQTNAKQYKWTWAAGKTIPAALQESYTILITFCKQLDRQKK